MNEIYRLPSHPAAYGGVDSLASAAHTTRAKSKYFLRRNKTYRKFFRNVTKFPRARILVSGMSVVWQADLFDLRKFTRENRGYGWLLIVVDSFSRLVCARALKHKSGSSVAEGLKTIFGQLREKSLLAPRSILLTDCGTEFNNEDVKRVYEEFGVNHSVLRAPKKASLAEVSGRHILTRIYRRMYDKQHNKWVDELEDFVAAKNRRKNRALGNLASKDVTYENQDEVYKTLYPASERTDELPLSLGTKVQLAFSKGVFHKSFAGYFSDAIYEIVDRFEYNGRYRYIVIDTSDGVELSGSWYAEEMLVVENAEE